MSMNLYNILYLFFTLFVEICYFACQLKSACINCFTVMLSVEQVYSGSFVGVPAFLGYLFFVSITFSISIMFLFISVFGM